MGCIASDDTWVKAVEAEARLLGCAVVVVSDAPADLSLHPLDADPRTLREWVTNFHVALFAIDPYTNESAWLLQTMARVMRIFGDADVRVAWLVTGDAVAARAFLGPLAVEFLTFTDPDRTVVRVLGLERLPAMVHVRTDLTVGGSVQGWHSREWRELCNRLADVMSWKAPQIPVVGDPSPFAGSPALG
jgi:hypothetical protein